ncbi:hypothetical protein [Ruminococcus sp.]|uniref:hypothetical protein n=1 Tax=Ruminococcus sp. TaxID=41978 RepID=UPI002582C1B6|nr:hypothetical protein [Ruminococcus sp.]MCR5020105.1 hypothetical protein [Ruminococcus sp.]
MKQVKIQKNINLRDQKTKNLIEKRSADLSKKISQSTSFVIENALIEGLFPKNKEARDLTTNYLYTDEPNNVKNTLYAVFQNNTTGIRDSLHTNLLPIVMFCLKHYKGPSNFSRKEQDLYHLIDQLNIILKRINNCVAATIEINEKEFLCDRATSAADLIKKLEESPEKVKPYYIFELIADFFAMLDDFPYTYSALSDLTSICQFIEDVDTRIELFDIINELSADWDKKIEIDDNNKKIYLDLYLNRVRLKICKDKRFAEDCLAVYANDACVGYVTVANNELLWKKSFYVDNPRYQFRNEDIFASVVAELIKYKNEHGYKYLVIDSLCEGYASILDHDLISSVGFKQLPDNHPALYYLD